MLQNMTCEQCGKAYHGDPTEVRLCLDCDDDPWERNVSLYAIDSLTAHEFPTFATLEEAFAAADDTPGLEDAYFVVDEQDAISHHAFDIHYRNDAHRHTHQKALAEASKKFRDARRK